MSVEFYTNEEIIQAARLSYQGGDWLRQVRMVSYESWKSWRRRCACLWACWA
jgi:hypothetical protein